MTLTGVHVPSGLAEFWCLNIVSKDHYLPGLSISPAKVYQSPFPKHLKAAALWLRLTCRVSPWRRQYAWVALAERAG